MSPMNKPKINLTGLPSEKKEKLVENSLNEFKNEFIKRSNQTQPPTNETPMPILYAYKTQKGIVQQKIGTLPDLLELNLHNIHALSQDAPMYKSEIASALRNFADKIEEGESC